MRTTLSIQDLGFQSDLPVNKEYLEQLPRSFWQNEVQEALDLTGDEETVETIFFNLCRADKCEVLTTPIAYVVTRVQQFDDDYYSFDVEFDLRYLNPKLIAEQLQLGNKDPLKQITTFEKFEGVAAAFDPDSDEFEQLCEAQPELAAHFC